MKFGLAELLSGTGVKNAENFDPEFNYVSHGPLERMPELLEIPELRTPEAFIKNWTTRDVYALPNKSMKSFEALKNPLPEQLPRLYDAGFTFYFMNVQYDIPALNPLLRQLERELGLRPETMSAEAFISSAGHGSLLHCDPSMAFNLQIVGKKKWKMFKNNVIRKPHAAWSIGTPLKQEFSYASADKLPKGVPADAQSFDTAPGSTVYVPHGYWHETEVSGPSLALLFAVVEKPWYDLVGKQLSRLLMQEEKWRDIPLGLESPAFWVSHRQNLEDLLNDLKRAVGEITVDSLRERFGGPNVATYQIPEGVKMSLSDEKSGKRIKLQVIYGGKSKEVEIDSSVKEVMTWVLDQKGPFSPAAASMGMPRISQGIISKIFDEFSKSGILKKIS